MLVAQGPQEFDRVIVETTGIADPTPLAQLFYTDMTLNLTYRLDAVLTMIDLKHFQKMVDTTDEARKQIAFADKLILNKRDLVSDAEYSDFVVRFKFRVVKGNSGFYFRSDKVKHAVGVNGFQAEVENGQPALVHCHAGKDRTGLALSTYLIRHHGLDAEDAIDRVRSVQPVAMSAPGYEATARRFAAREQPTGR